MDNLTKGTILKCSILKRAADDLIADQKTKIGCEGFYGYWQGLGCDYLRAALGFNLHNLRVALINGDFGKEFHTYHHLLIIHLKEAKQQKVHQDMYWECNKAIGEAFEKIEEN